ncbi:MAG TPA: PD-(D/E)XK nuclease family protein, partial [bacterium]|nr:PD-(D/E)XK nuclease family protein [bacterium]
MIAQTTRATKLFKEPGRRLLLFPLSFPRKTEFVLKHYLAGQDWPSLLYLTTHVSKIVDFKTTLLKVLRVNLPPDCFTLQSLAKKLVEENSPRRLISRLEKYTRVAKLVRRHRLASGRHSFSGLSLSVSNFIQEIKVHTRNLHLEEIRQTVSHYSWKYEESRQQALAALEIMEAYENDLEKEQLMDPEDIYRQAIPFVKFLPYSSFLVEAVYEVPAYQQDFLLSLLRQIPSGILSFTDGAGVPVDVAAYMLSDTMRTLHEGLSWKQEHLSLNSAEKLPICFQFASMEEEVKGIISLIGDYLRQHNDGCPEDCLVVFPEMLKYRPLVKRLFGRYQVPCEIIPGLALDQEPSVSILLELFRLVDTFSWERLMAIISSPFLKVCQQSNCEDFSRFSRERCSSTGYFREDFDRETDSVLLLLKRLLQEINDTSTATLKRWCRLLEKTAEQLQWNPGDPEILYLFQQLLVELESSLRLHRRELTGFLQQALSLIEVEKGRGSGVKITGVQETAGLQKRLCIIGGATEEALPQSVRRMDIFLPDRLKAELNLDTYQRRLARERLDLYRLLHENENVYFSYPATHQGKPQMRSILLNSFQHEIWPRPVFKSAVGKVFTDDFSWEKVLGALSDGRKLKISVNGLEKLLQCPYRFFLEKIAGLTPYQIPAVEEIPTFWGHLVHTALEELGRQQCQQEITESTIQGWTEFFENRVRQLLAVAYQEEHRCCGLIKEILEQRLPEVTARVRKILSAHVGRVVVAVEQDFQVESASWCLRGKVDRIEKNSRETILEIIDFKTGVTP